MEQKNTRENTEMSEVISTTEAFIEKNKKLLIGVTVGAIIVALAIFGIINWSKNRNEKANAASFGAEQYFAQGQWQLALDGDEKHIGLLDVIDKYGCTKTGNRAKYDAGVCYLNLGQFDKAIDYLKDYKGKDAVTGILAEAMIGDAEAELGHNDEALRHYEKAYKMDTENKLTAPSICFKAGEMCRAKGDNAKALEYYKIVKNFPTSPEYNTIDTYIGVVEAE